jgi:serine/threonine protein kinase
MVNKIRSHYRILEKLAEGGMGVVYKAQDTKLDRIVAVKFLPEYLLRGEVAKTRFVQEARAASALDHPNITAICEIDEAESKCPVCIEHVERKPIKQLMFVTETSRRDTGTL